jgi:hypothetical protein
MSSTHPTTAPVTPDPVPREVGNAIAFCLARAKESDETADRIRAEGGDPLWHVERADSERRQAYVLRLEAITGQRCCTRCLQPGHTRLGERECRAPVASIAPPPSPVHAAERAFLAAYRAQRDNAWTSLRRRLAGMPDTLEDEYKAAQSALDAADAADAAARDGAK